jgi:AraC-like DNA-binding protein
MEAAVCLMKEKKQAFKEIAIDCGYSRLFIISARYSRNITECRPHSTGLKITDLGKEAHK